MSSRRGVALMASLWLVVGIAAVGLEVSWLTRARRLHTLNALDADRTHAAAISGVEQARGRLTRALDAARHDALADSWRRLLGVDSATLDGVRYRFVVQDDAAAIDVNRATEAMLSALFSACGAEPNEAATSAARIADWRDADETPRPRGAERDGYLDAQARVLPRDAAVESVDELDDVLGIAGPAWGCAREHLVVHGAGLVNPNTAPREVLQALPGVSARAATAIIDARERTRLYEYRDLAAAVNSTDRAAMDQAGLSLTRLLTFTTTAVRIQSTGMIDGSPVREEVEALVRRSGLTTYTAAWRVR